MSEQPHTPADSIKTMRLYTHVERIRRELAERGLDADAPLDPALLEPLDQLHYGGRAAVQRAVAPLSLDAGSHVLEIGSGLGGPARHLAGATGCRVTALELQPDLHEIARELTRRCGLGERVEHRCGDALDVEFDAAPFDAIASWLTFLHVPARDVLLTRCRGWLDRGRALYIEDFHARRALQASERETLAREVYCRDLPDARAYRFELARAGFEVVEFEDLSDEWTAFVTRRDEAFNADAERFRRIHGRRAFDALAGFYRTMRELFAGGGLGGARIVARAA
jgi:cyclopropane fatty-acyl-phospholipid synthase-like methyltransferase